MNCVALLAVVMTIQTANAALPPQYQNMDDLNVMVQYVRTHSTVAARLKSINLQEFTIHFDDSCMAQFGRKTIINPPGWVGPAAALEFKQINCPHSEQKYNKQE